MTNTAYDNTLTVSGFARLLRWDVAEHLWILRSELYMTGGTNSFQSVGTKTLSGELTQVELTTAGGTAAFDAGEVRVRYRR